MKLPLSYFLVLLITFGAMMQISCKKGAAIPSYIHIDKINLDVPAADKATFGSNSSKISDAWVYVDDIFRGVYELPCTFPLLEEGPHTLTIKGGVKKNGIAATRSNYPFFKEYVQNVELLKGQAITVTPVLQYSSTTKAIWLEDFDGPGISFAKGLQPSDTTLLITTNPSEVFEGTHSGVARLNTKQDQFECVSALRYSLPKSNEDVVLELNYRSNNTFQVGVYAYFANGDIKMKPASINIRPTNEWNKIYVWLTPEVSQEVNAVSYVIYINMQKEEGVDTPTLFIDNVKLLHL